MNLPILNFYKFVNKKNKIKLCFYFSLILLVSIAELISLSALYPYITLLVDPNNVKNYLDKFPLIENNFTSFESNQLIFYISILLILVVLIAVSLRLLLLYISTKISYELGNELSTKIYLQILCSDYENHLKRKSSDLIDTVTRKSIEVTNYINSILVIASSLVIVLAITIVLLYVDYIVTISLFIAFTILYLIILFFTKNLLKRNSNLIAIYSAKSIKILQDSLGSIRDILLDRNQLFYRNNYSENDIKLKRAQFVNSFIGACPRYILEAFAMILIVILCFFKSMYDDGLLAILPTLTVCILGAQKLLPLFQAIYNNFTILLSISKSVEDCKIYLEKNIENNFNVYDVNNYIDFKNIILKNVYFKYGNARNFVLKDINAQIDKGDKILILGESGSGKSTLIDIIMGLLKSTSGEFSIDNRSIDPFVSNKWKELISHVPQNVYFSNASIIENIALGFDNSSIDMSKIKKCAKLAGISDYIESLPDDYKSLMGEQGGKLSGGQRQRIGIARALYKKSKLIIFDESTSALDEETEEKVISTISSFDSNTTLLIVSHRSSLRRYCNKIWLVKNSYLVEVNENN
jgi:ABC-type bacteriocin/lantibiotic exporter with double-glycine peptidase domain